MIRLLFSSIAVLSFVAQAPLPGAKPFRYSEAKYGKAELRYVNHVPLLTVEGPPEGLPSLGKSCRVQ